MTWLRRPGLARGGRAEGGWAAASQPRPEEPRSYRSARVRSQILEVGAVNGLQGLQLVGLSLRVALWRLVPAAPVDSTAPSHRNAAAKAGQPRGGAEGRSRIPKLGSAPGTDPGRGSVP